MTAEDIENFVLEMMDIFGGMMSDEAEALKHKWLVELAKIGVSSKAVRFLNDMANMTIVKATYM